MRSIINIFKARLKCSIKEPFSMMFILIAIIISIIPITSDKYQESGKIPVGIVCENKGEAYSRLIDMLNHYQQFDIYEWSYDKSIRNLMYDRLDAVYVLSVDFEDKVSEGEYRGILDAYSSISSPHLNTISEAIIDTTMTIAIGNLSVIETDRVLKEMSIDFTDADERALRDKISNVVEDGELIGVSLDIPTKPKSYAEEYKHLIDCTTWYCAFCAFFIIAGAGWIIDMTNKAIGERLKQMQIGHIRALIGASLVPIFLSIVGWCVSLGICVAVMHTPINILLKIIFATFLYFIGIMSMTLLISTMIIRTINLILIAPMVTLLHAVLSGMIVKLPDWAMRLEFISQVLPGRMYVSSINDILLNNGFIDIQTILVTFLWCILSFTIVLMKKQRDY